MKSTMALILFSGFFLSLSVSATIAGYANHLERKAKKIIRKTQGIMEMISQKNIHIEKFLDYYCNLNDAPEYGVMLDGPWGSGKTWFIKKYQEKLEIEQKKSIYLSLYGLSTTKEINEAIFQALHPILSHKSARLAGKILKGAIKATIKVDIDGDKKEDGSVSAGIPDVNLPDYLCNAEKHILIFDDIERSEIQINQLLGYINHFVEHEGMKCILVANEYELEAKSKTSNNKSYSEIRDKIIGKRFGFTSDIDSAISDFLNSPPCANSCAMLNKNIESIKSIYHQAGYDNFRHLKQALWDFDRVFSVIIQGKNLEPEIQAHVLQSLLLLSFEIRSGNLESKDIAGLNTQRMIRLVKNDKKEDRRTDEERHIDSILSKYDGVCATDMFPSEEFWEVFFEKGVIDGSVAEDAINNSRYRYDQNIPAWRRLWHGMNLGDEDFENMLSIVQAQFNNHEYKDICIVLHVFGLQLWLSDIGLIGETKKEIVEKVKSYIDLMGENELLPAETVYDRITSHSGYAGLAYFGRETPEFQEVVVYTNEIRSKQYVDSLVKKSDELIVEMHQDFSLFARRLMLSNSEDNTYFKTPILSKINPKKFIVELEKLGNEKKRELGYLLENHRYEFDQFLQDLKEEEPWLREIKVLLANEADIRKGKMSGHIYKSLAKQFENSILKFENLHIS